MTIGYKWTDENERLRYEAAMETKRFEDECLTPEWAKPVIESRLLNTLREQLNWIWDYERDQTEYPPRCVDWLGLQQSYFRIRGSYWNPQLGQDDETMIDLNEPEKHNDD